LSNQFVRAKKKVDAFNARLDLGLEDRLRLHFRPIKIAFSTFRDWKNLRSAISEAALQGHSRSLSLALLIALRACESEMKSPIRERFYLILREKSNSSRSPHIERQRREHTVPALRQYEALLLLAYCLRQGSAKLNAIQLRPLKLALLATKYSEYGRGRPDPREISHRFVVYIDQMRKRLELFRARRNLSQQALNQAARRVLRKLEVFAHRL
jgi:hypothetical protein